MFDHEKFDVYAYEDVPLDRDCYLMAEDYMQEYERAFLDFFNGGPDFNVGYISYAAVRRINDTSMDLSWYPDIFTRFHEVAVSLPRDQFITCVGCWQCDEKPHIFVKSAWLETLHLRTYSIFALVDANYFEDALRSGRVTRDKLINLRAEIDSVATMHSDVLFISFADSLLLKSNWTVGHFRSEIKYTYRPEDFLHIFRRLQKIYADIMGLGVHAVITQGSNAYYEDPLSHTSQSGNHVCLNSLGLPFAQLWAIGDAAKKHVGSKRHAFAELYMDEQYHHSLRLRYDFSDRRPEKHPYQCKMIGPGNYYCGQCEQLLDNLKPTSVEDNGKCE